MESVHIFYSVIVVAMGWFGSKAYEKHIDDSINETNKATEATIAEMNKATEAKIAEMANATELKMKEMADATELKMKEMADAQALKFKELELESQKEFLGVISKTQDTLQTLLLNKNLQDATNNPKKETLSLLEEDESMLIDDEIFTHDDIKVFEYVAPTVDDIEEEVTQTHTIESYNFTRKYFKLTGVAQTAISDVISPLERINLLTKADKQEEVKLRLKFIKDGISKKIKNIYILSVVLESSDPE
jgi:hypothetical protein